MAQRCQCTTSRSNMSRNVTKPTKWHVRPAKTQISLGIRPIWSESSLSAWRKLGSLAIHSAHSEDSDQTGRMPRLIWVFAGRHAILLVFSRCGSYIVNRRWKCTIPWQHQRAPKQFQTEIREAFLMWLPRNLMSYSAQTCMKQILSRQRKK